MATDGRVYRRQNDIYNRMSVRDPMFLLPLDSLIIESRMDIVSTSLDSDVAKRS